MYSVYLERDNVSEIEKIMGEERGNSGVKMAYRNKHGKYRFRNLPKHNNKPPKTKRMRKKKMWEKCFDCGEWFKTYTQTNGHLDNGRRICHNCVRVELRKSRPDLFEK